MQIKVKINYSKLQKAVEEMSKKYSVKVGLLADQGGSDTVSDNLDLAGLGAVHEFGCDIKITPKMAAYLGIRARELGLPRLKKKSDGYIHIPPRSFLQLPLTRKNAIIQNLKKQLGGMSVEEIEEYVFKTQDLLSLATMLGSSAVLTIREAFDTSGWGQWPANSPFTIAAKSSSKPLLDIGTLRSKITYEVEEK